LGDRAIAFLTDVARRLESDEAVSLHERDLRWFDVATRLRPDDVRRLAGTIIHHAPPTSDLSITAARALTRAEPIEHIEADQEYVTNFVNLAAASPALRPVAVSALARHPSREAADALVSILHDTDERSVRATVIEALTQHPLHNEACAQVLDQFLADRSATPTGTDLAPGAPQPDVRLGRVDQGELDTLLSAVGDGERAQELSRQLLRSLSSRGRSVAIKHLVPETDADVAELGRRARSIIASAGRRSRPPGTPEEAVESYDLDTGVTIEEIFAAMGRHPGAVSHLWRFTSEQELTPSQRQALANAMAATGDPRAATHLADLALWKQRANPVDAFAAFDDDEFDDDAPIEIPEAPITSDDATAAVALRAAGAIASSETDDLLRRFATNEDPALRAAALDGIARRLEHVEDPDDRQRFASLATDALESTSPEVRGAALRALANPDLPVDDAATAKAIAILEDAECPRSAVHGAIAALARAKDEHGEPHPALRALAASEERRADVLEALKGSGDVEVLAQLATDDGLCADPFLALELLDSLPSDDLGSQPEPQATLAARQPATDEVGVLLSGGDAPDQIPGAERSGDVAAPEGPALPPDAPQAGLGFGDHEGRRAATETEEQLPDHSAETRMPEPPRRGVLDEGSIIEPEHPGGDLPGRELGRDLGLGFGPGNGLAGPASFGGLGGF